MGFLPDLAWPAMVVFVGYVMLGLTGFGSALVIVPLLAWQWPLTYVVALTLLLDLPACVLHGGLNLKHVQSHQSARDDRPEVLGAWRHRQQRYSQVLPEPAHPGQERLRVRRGFSWSALCATGLRAVPSSATLRQRFDAMGTVQLMR